MRKKLRLQNRRKIMKSIKKVLLPMVLLSSMVGLAGCKSAIKIPVSFVAVTSTSYNAEVTIGDYSYTFRGSLESGKKFSLKGTVVTRVAGGGQGGGGGFPGGGFPGGGFPGGGFGPGGGDSGGEKAAPESVTMSLEKTTIYINEQVEAKLTFAPEGCDESMEWTSSDEKVATVSSGKITGVAEGTAVITGKAKKDASKVVTATITVIKEDLAAHNFVLTGSYVEEPGYGYAITFNDPANGNPTVHTDFDKTQGRHEFWYNFKIGDAEKAVKLQAKDANYKSKLAADYKKWDERDSSYIFYARSKGNNGSAATSYMYLHQDGSVVLNVPNGAERDVEVGKATWAEANGAITVTKGNDNYVSQDSVNSDHPGKLINYSGTPYLMSTSDVKWKKMTPSDFIGDVAYEFSGSYDAGEMNGTKQIYLSLFPDQSAKLFNGSWTQSTDGTWVEAAGQITVTLGPTVLNSVTENNKTYFMYEAEKQDRETTYVQVKLSQNK